MTKKKSQILRTLSSVWLNITLVKGQQKAGFSSTAIKDGGDVGLHKIVPDHLHQ